MCDLIEGLERYFKETPREKVLEDWKKCEEYNQIGPTLTEFLTKTQELNKNTRHE